MIKVVIALLLWELWRPILGLIIVFVIGVRYVGGNGVNLMHSLAGNIAVLCWFFCVLLLQGSLGYDCMNKLEHKGGLGNVVETWSYGAITSAGP